MNSKRVYCEINNGSLSNDIMNNHEICITDNWLLGFIEGDRSFSIAKKDNILTFSISQKGNLVLMEAIKKYLSNLASSFKEKKNTLNIDVIYITKSKNSSSETVYVLIVKSKEFVKSVLIPYFDTLTFYCEAAKQRSTKKKLDYLDWKSIGELKSLGLHCLSEGKILFDLIISQMNNNRLSTSGIKPVNRNLIDSQLNQLLNGPSNYEIIDGKIFIKSLNKFLPNRIKTQVELQDKEGLVFKTFDSKNQCAEFLGISTHTVSKRNITNSLVVYKNQEFFFFL
jgi:hypothetical protein